MDPDIGVRDPDGADRRLAQAGDRGRLLPRGRVQEPPAAGGDGLPARVAEAAAQRPRVVEQLAGVRGVAPAQRDLGAERLRERLEGDPAGRADESERALQGLLGRLELAADDVRAAEDGERPGGAALVAAAAGDGDRGLEQADRGLVVRAVRERHATHGVHRRALLVELDELGGAHEPAAGGDAAAGLHLDVAQLAADLGGDVALAVLLRQGERLVQDGGALLVAAADGVDERDAQRGEHAGEQRRIADRPRLGAGVAQAGEPGLDGAGVERGAAGIELPERGGPVADGAQPVVLARLHGARHTRIRRAAELAAEQDLARGGVLLRRGELARGREAADQQLVGVLVELVVRERAGGEARAVERAAGGQRGVGGVVEERLAGAGEPAPLDQQPGLEHRPGVGLDPLQELAAGEPGVGVVVGDRVDVDARARREAERQRVAGERLGRAERAAELGQRPAQRAERVLGAAEGELRQAGARHRPVRQREVREHRPGLAAARGGRGDAVAQDLRRAQQAELETGHQAAAAESVYVIGQP